MNEIKRGDLYYADLSPIFGSEQDGFRPVLVIQNDLGNATSNTTIVAAVTSRTEKKKLPTHIRIKAPDLPLESVVLTEQLRTIDIRRLGNFIDHQGVGKKNGQAWTWKPSAVLKPKPTTA